MTNPHRDRIRQSRRLLQNQYAYLAEDGGFEAELPESDPVLRGGPSNSPSRIAASDLLAGKNKGDRFRRTEIEEIARRLHLALWGQRSALLSSGEVTPLDVVNPSMALMSLGFDVLEDPSLGDVDVDGELLGVAGLLDRDNSRVSISPRYPADIQRFTLAHELGHVVLHQGSGLHRDRGLNGAPGRRPSSPEEAEANFFAAAFLMPAKLVRAEFRSRFATEHLVMTEEAAFGLGAAATAGARRDYKASQDLCRQLASAEHFHGTHFPSLAQRFQVSESAMAIRLRELELVDS
ncbi:MAG: ImmA/IrrE family metallo-endopeptidase [Myxococcales bacterium]|nr:ImmA/IrrE family metallo-endopeptidase [Myxococcales bacterium]